MKRLLQLGLGFLGLCLPVAWGQSPPAGHLANRYSFTADATDSVGGATGQLMAGAVISNNAVVLNGSTAYVNLPNNLVTGLTSLTFEAWVTEGGGGGWARLLDFGNSSGGEDAQGGGTSYLFVAWPAGGGNSLRGCYRLPGTAEMYLDVSPRPAQGVPHHFVWTQDAASSTARIYLDGVLQGTLANFTYIPAAVGPTVNDWLGRSQYNDPYFNGSIDEFRIYDFALPDAEITRNYQLGPDAAPLGPAQFLAQPADSTVGEAQPFTFVADVTGAPPFACQWYRDGAPIPAATNQSFSGTATLVDENATFQLRVTNTFTNTLFVAVSAVARLHVLADTNPPQLLSAAGLGTNTVVVRFSEALRPDTATNLANYTLTGPAGGVALTDATLTANGNLVTLATAPLAAGASYTLSVAGVRDLAAAANLIPPGSQAAFVATPLPVADIGLDSPSGLLQYTNNGQLALSAAGVDIGGTADQCAMTFVSVTGDFDQQVRLAGFAGPELWSKAGLMARETLDPASPFAAALASPGSMGCFFGWRAAVGAGASFAGQLPANYPQTWLRLRRAGSVFTGYASDDGLTWTRLGTATLSLSNTLQLGIAVASHAASQPATVQFADYTNTVSPLVGNAVADFEPLGPCSRRTALVISEMMYKPAPRPDGRNLEFIELYNANPFFHDLSGHRLSGDVDFTFPAGTVIPGGGFIVVAANPADLQAVYGLTGVFGPYTHSLKTSGTVRLRDEQDTILLEVNYDSAPPWPVAASGTGHSLVLARPSYGENDPRAWDISDVAGGSPEAAETFRPSPRRSVVLNEILAHTDPPDLDTIELYNHGNTAVDLSGCTLSDDPVVNKYVVPTNTVIAPRGFVYFTEAQLGFALNAAGETVYFRNPDGSRVLDALQFEAQENGVSFGRYPDGAAQWYRLAAKTFGTNNAPPHVSPVGLNEVMYHPISGDDDDQYVELFNQGTNAVNLVGWKLLAGVSYTFPTNTVLGPGAYLVVAANASRLITNYPQLNAANTLGNFRGRLAHGGERLALAMPDTVVSTNISGFPVTNHIDIVVDEVTYGTGGRWGKWADGGGSSLELIDPRADKRLAANWADSDESTKAAWANIETTGTLDNGSSYSTDPIGYAQLGLMDAGECLIDNVEIRPGTTGANYVANPDFESGLANWSLQGAFSRSGLQPGLGYGGGAALQLRTDNRLFTLGNSAQCALSNTSLASGQTATMRFKARWLHGCRDIVFRLNGNWLEAAGTLPVPANLGTPGLPNSRAVPNAPPALWSVSHSPALPAANDLVVVTARVSDPDGLASCQLLYRLDPGTSYASLLMRDDGTGGDAVAGDGIFSATLPARPAGTATIFIVQATDRLGATARFPALVNDNGPVRECVVRYGDPEPPGGFGIYHLWLTQTNVNRWLALPIMSNEELDATLVYRNRVIYNAGARYSGSPYHENVDGPAGVHACHFIWSMPKDDQFLGTTAFNKIHWPGNDIQDDTISANNNDSTLQREQVANTFLRGLGVPWVPRRYVVVYVNGVRRGQVMEDALRPSGSVPEAYFPNDTGGSLYKIQPWFEGTAFPNSSGFIAWQNKSWATVNPYRTTGGAYKTARYRWHYEPRDVPASANDYTNVFTLIDAMNAYNDPDYPQIVSGVVDVDQWLRVIAANHAAGNWDCYGIQNGQNVFGYVSPQRRWQMFMFDFNIVVGNRIAWSPGANLEATPEPGWAKMHGASGHPQFRRLYWRALKELVNGALRSGICNPLVDARYVALRASGINATDPQPIKDWVAAARTSIAAQVASHDASAFAVVAGPILTSSNPARITGTAPLEVDAISVGGHVCPVTWTTLTAWSVLAPVPPGSNTLVVLGFDRHGDVLAGASNAVTVVSTAVPEAPEGRLAINEIMHHPAQPEADYVELFNAATNTAFDLSGWELNGLGYTFPAGAVIAPQNFLVLARSRTAFATAYGVSNVAFDAFPGGLQADGETLSLLHPGASNDLVVVDRVRYETVAPWPALANQPGIPLQLIDPAQDHRRVANWGATTNTTYTAPDWLYVSATGTATSSRLYLFLSAAGDVYVDDMTLVAGAVPGQGANLLSNGGFESALSGSWSLAGDLVSSVRDTTVHRTGVASLHVIATGNGGSGNNDAVYQALSPALVNGQTYSVGGWYRPTTNANGGKLVVRLSNSTATAGLYAAVDPSPPPVPANLLARTPGAVNSLRANLPAFPPLWLNEVQPQNLTGPADNAGEHDPWLEIYNASATTQSLAGFYLGTNYAGPAQWAFPTNATLAPGQFRLVWADGQPAQSTGSIWHTSFRLSPGSGAVVLSRFVSNAVQVVDYLNYTALPANYSYGDVPDGQPCYRQPLFRATPGASNSAALPPVTVFINEWMAENTGFITDPATAKYEDWFELYNPANTPAELVGLYLTDTLTDPLQYQIPAGYRVPARGFLLVWADGKPSANSTNSPDLHAPFKLDKSGEAIGLFLSDGTAVDAVLFDAQSANMSEGRYPDGGNLRLFMPAPSPGAPNLLPPANTPPAIQELVAQPGGGIALTFQTAPGHTYRVEFKDDLTAARWLPLGADQFATGPTLTGTDTGAAGQQRFYRIVQLD